MEKNKKKSFLSHSDSSLELEFRSSLSNEKKCSIRREAVSGLSVKALRALMNYKTIRGFHLIMFFFFFK